MLTKKAQYALYALRYLAFKKDKGPVLIKEIVEAEFLPQKFIEAILVDLKNAGFVNSKKGKNGGYYLIKEPKDINFADIIRIFDGAIALLPCATYKYYEKCTKCNNDDDCGLRNVVKEIRDKTVAIMKELTLQDVIDRDSTGRYVK
ncbi:MAG TPA: Rrf2 family transcriptional regulator [Bacteroidales bacterium]|jgi:Rrf2 family protein|nr:Rrf2 family transcriptional regulator [Bacteroidales bacterium]HOU97687.1 Rrf2 family transcriptional regulator [Bacteroidales bacterium]